MEYQRHPQYYTINKHKAQDRERKQQNSNRKKRSEKLRVTHTIGKAQLKILHRITLIITSNNTVLLWLLCYDSRFTSIKTYYRNNAQEKKKKKYSYKFWLKIPSHKMFLFLSRNTNTLFDLCEKIHRHDLIAPILIDIVRLFLLFPLCAI